MNRHSSVRPPVLAYRDVPAYIKKQFAGNSFSCRELVDALVTSFPSEDPQYLKSYSNSYLSSYNTKKVITKVPGTKPYRYVLAETVDRPSACSYGCYIVEAGSYESAHRAAMENEGAIKEIICADSGYVNGKLIAATLKVPLKKLTAFGIFSNREGCWYIPPQR